MNRIIAAAAATLTAAALAAIPVAASATTRGPPPPPAVHVAQAAGLTDNWAGYIATATHPKTDPMRVVSAEFKVPHVSCANSIQYDGKHQLSEATMWAGLGGVDKNKDTLEQAGIIIICTSKTATPLYGAWWEILPQYQSTQLTPISQGGTVTAGGLSGGTRPTILPGDDITVIIQDNANSVAGTAPYQYNGAPAGHSFDMYIGDSTAGDSSWELPGWGLQQAATNPAKPYVGDETTAEVVTEAVTGGIDAAAHIGIVDTGIITYHNILATDYTNAGTYHGLSTNPGVWSTSSVKVGPEFTLKPFQIYPRISSVTHLSNIPGDYQYGAGYHAFSTFWENTLP